MTIADLRADLDAGSVINETARDSVISRLVERVAARGDSTLDVLVLSGGGQHGAFGAGFLAGWSARTDAPMPRFDVVTGVSTGALLAPFAFIGTPEALSTVAALYRDPDAIMPEKDAFGAVFRGTGALFNVSSLKATIEEVVNAEMVGAILAECAQGRQLLVGSTDLDIGRGRVWNVAAEIDTSAAGVQRLRGLLLASVAIPGAFPPVMIDGHYHADGGITTNLLAGDLVFYRDLARALGVHRTAGRVTVRLWVIVNMTLGPGPEVVDVDDALAISARAMILLFKLNQQQTLMRFWEICEAVNAGVERLAIEMHYTAIPDAWNDEPGAMELFNEAYMNRLQDFGNELAKSANPWATLPPGPF